MTPEHFVLEVVATVAALERGARSHDAVAESGTADEARAARKSAEELRATAQTYADALPQDWPDLIEPPLVLVPSGPARPPIGKW